MTTALKRTLRILGLFVSIGLVIGGCKKKEEELPAVNIKYIQVTGGQILASIDIGTGGGFKEKGIVIDKTTNPTIESMVYSFRELQGSFIVSDLELNTTYYAKAFVKNDKGSINYSSENTFTTDCIQIDSVAPEIVNYSSNITIYGRGFSNNNTDNIISINQSSSSSKSTTNPTFSSSDSLVFDFSGISFGTDSTTIEIEVNKLGDACPNSTGGIISNIEEYPGGGYSLRYSNSIIFKK